MNKNLNIFVILAILIIPIFLYSTLKSPDKSNITMAAAGKPVVLKFTSPLCMECKELEKVMTVIIPKYEDKVVFEKINVNSSDPNVQAKVQKYDVNVVPTMIFINSKGKVVKKTEGSLPEAQLEKILDELIDG